MEKNQPKIVVESPEKDILDAIKLIDKFLQLNNITFKYSININHSLDCHGVFYPEKENEICVNPSFLAKSSIREVHDKKYSMDYSLFGVSVHEFTHAFSEKHGLNEEYKKLFKEKTIINSNCLTYRFEELAELFSLYLVNPYFLKHIALEPYNFLKEKYISPTPTIKASFLGAWRKWGQAARHQCKSKWGIHAHGNKVFV